MNVKKFLPVFMVCAVMVLGAALTVEARVFNKDGTLEIRGKVQSKFTFKTRDSWGWPTYKDPFGVQAAWGLNELPELDAWDLKQHRNIAYIEVDYDMKKASGVDVKLHATGRFLYEGVYDYGPDEITDVRDNDKDRVDDMTRDADLWEGYVDVTKGPFFIRVGRQKISWGETDVYPMLDRIMPIDDTYGGFFEDLDDRRIPLWAVRTTYNFGRVGFCDSLSVEGFWNPGFVDQQFTPQPPWGTVYAFPQSPWNGFEGFYQKLIEPDDDLQASRYGVRIQGVIGNNLNWAIAHFKTFLDAPALQLKLDDTGALAILEAVGAVPGGTAPISLWDRRIISEDHFAMHQLVTPIHITGASFSFFEPHVDAIFRSELAYFHDEPAFNQPMNLKPLTNLLFGGVMPSVGGELGDVPYWDVFRFSVAVDKPFWIRAINKKSMINVSLELFNEYYMDYESDYRLAAPIYPSGELVDFDEWEHTLVTLIYTNYMSGRLNPTILAGYNVEGAGFFQPSLEYRMDPFIFKVHYAYIFGDRDIAPGILDDWEQLSFMMTFVF